MAYFPNYSKIEFIFSIVIFPNLEVFKHTEREYMSNLVDLIHGSKT